MIVVIIAALVLPPSLGMVYYIVLGKGIASLICVLLSWLIMIKRLPGKLSLNNEGISGEFMQKFLTHAGLMWVSAVLKSLTEQESSPCHLLRIALALRLATYLKLHRMAHCYSNV